MRKNWKLDEDDLLVSRRLELTYEELARLLNRTKVSIAHRISRLGLPESGLKYLSKVRIELSKLSQAEKGYLAGYIDADGSIGIYRQRRMGESYTYYPNVELCSMNLSIMNWFSRVLKVNITKGKARWSHNEPVYMVQMHRIADTRELLLTILPYLKLKKREAEIAIKMANLKLACPRKGQRSTAMNQLYQDYISIHHSRRHGNNAFKIS